MNKTSTLKLKQTFAYVIALSFGIICSVHANSVPAGKIGEATNEYLSLESAKFQVAADQDSTGSGTLIISCEGNDCTDVVAKYDAQTKIDRSGDITIAPHDLKEYSGQTGDITIRKSDQHIISIGINQ